MDLIRTAWHLLVVCSELSILYWISTKIAGTRVSNLAVSFGRDLTTMYMGQWYIIGLLLAVNHVLEFTPLSVSWSIVTTVVVIAVAYILSELYLEYIKGRVPLLRSLRSGSSDRFWDDVLDIA